MGMGVLVIHPLATVPVGWMQLLVIECHLSSVTALSEAFTQSALVMALARIVSRACLHTITNMEHGKRVDDRAMTVVEDSSLQRHSPAR